MTVEQRETQGRPRRTGVRRIVHAIQWRSQRQWARIVGLKPVHWSRVVMNRETERYVRDLGPATKRVLEISGDRWKDFGFASYESVGYPEFNICEQTLDGRFDLIIAEQVLEHVLWPYRAVKNMREMLNPGGALLVTTPFLVRIHDYPTDCCRWTETGIKYLLAECGFDLKHIKTGSWGNEACVKANLVDWPLWKERIHSLENDPRFPIVVWSLAENH